MANKHIKGVKSHHPEKPKSNERLRHLTGMTTMKETVCVCGGGHVMCFWGECELTQDNG